MNNKLIKRLDQHGIESVEQDNQVYAVSVAVDCGTLAVQCEWVVVDSDNIREFLGY